MPYFYYQYTLMDDGSHEYIVSDRRLGEDDDIAICPNSWTAEKVVAALNAAEPVPAPKSLGIFG